MVRLPRIKIGEDELEKPFHVGSIRKVSKAINYNRKIRLIREQAEIVGIPTAWISCLNRVGLFSNTDDLIKQCWAHGSAQKKDLDAIQNFNFHERLARVGLGHFRDPTRIIKGKKSALIFHHDIDMMHPQFTIEELRRMFGIDFGVVEDGIIEFIHVKDELNNVNVLWQKFTKFKEPIIKIWDDYAIKINELHVRYYGKRKTTSHLDVVAVHEDDDWFKNNYKVKEAINKAYEPSLVKSILEPMMGETDARGVLIKRTEFPREPRRPTEVELLFPGAPSFQRKL